MLYIQGTCYQVNSEKIGDRPIFTLDPKYNLTDSKVRNIPKPKRSQNIEIRWYHLAVMGNSVMTSKDGSLVFGVPYAWIGQDWKGRYSNERRVGTIAKFDKVTKEILVQNPVEIDGYGAPWAYGSSRQEASWEDPRRNDLTGVSFVKGNLSY